MRDRTKQKGPKAHIWKKPLSKEERRAILERLMQRDSALTLSEATELQAVYSDIRAEYRKVARDQFRGLSEQEKDDVEQEAFFGLFRLLCNHGLKEGIEAPLRVIARNQRSSYVRRKLKVQAQESLGVPSSGSEKPDSDPPDIDGAVDFRELGRRAREQLSSDQWAAFDRIVLQGKSYPEAVSELGAPEPTLRSRVKRAKRVLFELVDRAPPSSEGGEG